MKIFINNLKKYNQGYHVLECGKWYSLPLDIEEVEEELLNNGQDEYIITDHMDCPFEVGEYDSLNELNEKAEAVEDMGYEETKILFLLLDHEGLGWEEALQVVENKEYHIYVGCNNMKEVAEEYLEERGFFNRVRKELKMYFDFEAYGRDLEVNENIIYSSDLGCYVQYWG